MPPRGQKGKKGRIQMKGFLIFVAAATLLLATAITGYGFVVVGNSLRSLNIFDGNEIYAVNCAYCHGPMASPSDPNVMSANVGQIVRAFRLHTSMSHYVYSVNTSVALGAVPRFKGRMSLAQLKAIIAAFAIYRGENLYNAKYPDNQTYNCSFCHGPYDNSNVSHKNFRQIILSFRQNRSRNNPMVPLRREYKPFELKLIAGALAVAPPYSNTTSGNTGTVDPVQGAILFYTDCISCHDADIKNLPTDLKNASTPAGIQNAITTNAGAGSVYGGMDISPLTELSSAQIADISAAIQNNVDPPTNWAGYSWPGCITCHNGGPL